MARIVSGCAFAIAGAFVLISMLSGAHVDDSRRTRAWGQWQQEPTAATEAAWVRERDRVARSEGLLMLAGALMLGGGVWLAIAPQREKAD